jgi:hypothetical protein
MLRALSLFALAAIAQSQFIGALFSTSSAGNAVSLNALNGDFSIAKPLSTIPVGSETVSADTVRCVPGGTVCYFLTNDGTNSYLYNVTLQGKLNQKVTMPGVMAHNLHAFAFTGAAITILQKPGSAVIAAVQNNVVSPILDISKYLGNGGTIHRGGSTQCSDTNVMWVGINGGPGQKDTLVYASLNNATVLSAKSLPFAFFDSVWAYCDDQTDFNELGGVMLEVDPTSGVRTLQYNFYSSSSNSLKPGPAIQLPAGQLSPNGLLSMPDDKELFFATVYPDNTQPGDKASGFVAQWNLGGAMTLSPIAYNLYGAARYE